MLAKESGNKQSKMLQTEQNLCVLQMYIVYLQYSISSLIEMKQNDTR